jgi:uncharacterized membrane protein
MTPEDPAPADDFYSRTIERIQRIMIVIGTAAFATAQAYFGWRISLGMLCGCIIGYVNFYWLRSIVSGVAELTVRSGTPASSRRIVYRFLLRYLLMAVAAYAILSVSRESLYGLFAGLLLPVAALFCEAAYEAYAALMRRI